MDVRLLKKYFKGKCFDHEKLQAEQYIKNNPKDVDAFLSSQWKEASNIVSEDYSKDLKQSIDFKTSVTKKGRQNLVYAIASIVLVFIVGHFYIQIQSEKASNWETVGNDMNTTKIVRMNDNSTIWLKPGSSISYQPSNYNKENRAILLSGEGFFDISKNKELPFTVTTGELITKVLGTKFNIKAYEFEHEIQVVLSEGSIQLTRNKQDEQQKLGVLKPGEMMKYDKINNNSTVTTTGNSLSKLYTSNNMVFHNETINAVLKRLARVYNLNVNTSMLTKEQKNATISGVFTMTKPIEIIEKILFIHNLKIKRKNQVLYPFKKQQ